MTHKPNDWVAPTGLRPFDAGATGTAIPASAMNDPRLSLTARGLYALLLSYQGEPIDPYEDAIGDFDDIRSAIDELVNRGYVVRVARADSAGRNATSFMLAVSERPAAMLVFEAVDEIPLELIDFIVRDDLPADEQPG